jgi:integrase
MVETQPSVTKSGTVRSRRPREHLTDAEIERLMTVARRDGRYGHRDATAVLVAYRHGLRSSELVDLQWDQIDFVQKTIRINRVKNGSGSTHYLSNSELRALRKAARKAVTEVE